MGRLLKKVPLDFDWPIGAIWPGYMLGVCGEIKYCIKNIEGDKDDCKWCKRFSKLAGIGDGEDCPDVMIHPPKGDGYQLWEDTTEGSPMSPVFKTLDELCEYAENNCPIFGNTQISKEEWKNKFGDKVILHKEGDVIYC